MKIIKHLAINILVCSILLFTSICKINAQISGNDLSEVIDLYLEEQYTIVVSKLSNKGFYIKASTPDYTSGKISYVGDFMMFQPYDCFNKIPPDFKETTNSYIKFSSQIHPSVKYFQIECSVIMPSAQNYLQTKAEQWKREMGPGKITIDTKGDMNVEFTDTNDYYGRNTENSSSLVVCKPKYRFIVNTHNYPPNVLCTSGYTILEGWLFYNFPKYPVENQIEYFNNLDENLKLLKVPVKKNGNTYLVEIMIGGKSLIYIIDSGASEMFISNSTEKYLLELGIIRNSDYLPSKTFSLADGSEKIFRRVKIPFVKLGSIKVDNVEAAITDDNAPMLLGKSFLDKFKYWKVNNSNLTVEFQY